MSKLFLQILVIFNLAQHNIFSMEYPENIISKTEDHVLFSTDQNELKLWSKTTVLNNVIEIVKAPNGKYAIAVVADSQEFPDIYVYLINYSEDKFFSSLTGTISKKPFSLTKLDSISGEHGKYVPGNCKISPDSKNIKIKVGILTSSFTTNMFEEKHNT